ncbi:MAG TPA: ATP-binding protein [Paucimonas sp.]|nr:ATP-binding protein [Paucimonas sp.]
MKSIRHTLLLWLFAGLSSGIALAAALLYLQAREEANRIFDYQMRQIVASLPSQSFAPMSPRRYEDPGMERGIVIQIWGENGIRIYHSHERSALPQRAELGFSNVDTPDGTWRVYSAQQGDTVVQVAQPLRVRHELATDMALRTVAPLCVLFPFLGLLAWIAVGKGLAPVKRVAADVQARDAGSLSPVTDIDLPQEIRPLTQALNDLLARLERSIDAQRAFIADAAHELRTPLTALKLRIQLAERAQDETERAAAFAELKQGHERAIRMVQQLLTLARQEPGTATPGTASRALPPVDLASLARAAVAEFASTADAAGIDLGLSADESATVDGDADSLRALLNNLIDNAIRYTPAGGRIDVTVAASASGCTLRVQDSGPGIPDHELGRVFDRFYRVAGSGVEGSGLGLAIVKRIAESHHAHVSLRNTRPGLCAAVVFPCHS